MDYKKSPNSLADRVERQKNGQVTFSGAAIAEIKEAGISIFDPVLCEIIYRWFSAEGHSVLDPFAGGSVRGIVASKLNRKYTGIELRKEQVDSNVEQGTLLCKENMPEWICGTSTEVDILVKDLSFDLIFSCPPYADLEVYSDDPRDISNMSYDKFIEHYSIIIAKSCALLKENRFACFVVGEVREKKGMGKYRAFVPDTIECFKKAGLSYYNEAILVTSVGSLPIRTKRMFESARKLGKTHQNILVFCKGDAREAAKQCGEIKLDESFFINEGGVDTGEDL
jgi:DNA modification methylase